MHFTFMSVPLEPTKLYFTDNFNKLSYLVAKPTAYQQEANKKRSGAVRTSTMIAVKSDSKGVDRKSIKKPTQKLKMHRN